MTAARAIELLVDLSGKDDASDFHRGVAGKILIPDYVAGDAFVI